MPIAETVRSARADGRLLLTVNRPDELNPLNNEWRLTSRFAFERVDDGDAGRAHLLSGAWPGIYDIRFTYRASDHIGHFRRRSRM